MAGKIDEYKKLFREATVAWLILNMMGYIKIDPALAMWYSPVGWGILVIVHYWFYIRGAENLCMLREEMVEAKIG